MATSMPPAALQQYLSVYFTSLDTLEATQTFTAAVCGVVVWDWAVTLFEEIEHVWLAGWSFLNFIMLCNRYILLAAASAYVYFAFWTHNTPEQCERFITALPTTVILQYLLGNVIITVRLYALWDRSRSILAIMVSLILAELGMHIYVAQAITPVVLPPGLPALSIPPLSSCMVGPGVKDEFYVMYMMPLCFDCVAFGLASATLLKLWRNGARSTIVKKLISNGLAFFALSMVASLANVVHFAITSAPSNRALIAPLAPVVHCVCASRMVFSLRKTAKKGDVASGPAKVDEWKLPSSNAFSHSRSQALASPRRKHTISRHEVFVDTMVDMQVDLPTVCDAQPHLDDSDRKS